jgi:hypothetical protein
MYRWIVSPASAKIVAMELMRADERPRQTEAAPRREAVEEALPATATTRRRSWFARVLARPLGAQAGAAQTSTPDA